MYTYLQEMAVCFLMLIGNQRALKVYVANMQRQGTIFLSIACLWEIYPALMSLNAIKLLKEYHTL